MIQINLAGNDDVGPSNLGAMSPPADLIREARSSGLTRHAFWETTTQVLWDEFKAARPDWDCDTDFLDWLVAEKGWEEIDDNRIHTFIRP